MKRKSITAKELEKQFDAGEDITQYMDISSIKRPGRDPQRVNVDFPGWMLEELDKEAARIGVPRQSLIKVWIAERLERCKQNQAA